MTGGILQEIAARLERVTPSPALQRQMEEDRDEIELEIGLPPLLYKRDSISPEETAGEMAIWCDIVIGSKPRWGARCRCTWCSEEFITGWSEGGLEVIQRDDVEGIFPGIPDGNEMSVRYEEGQCIKCPYCDRQLELVRKSKLPDMGRTRRIMLQDVQDLEVGGIRYTVVIAWLMSRWVHDTGIADDIDPVEAYILDTDGRIIRMKRHITALGGQIGELLPHWERVQRVRDPSGIRYFSAEAINRTKIGSLPVAPIEPEQLAGTTGEKTGLAELLAEESARAVSYLMQWRRSPYLENLLKAGWAYTVEHAVRMEVPVDTWADLRQRKPARMLGMTRAEVQLLGTKRWTTAIACAWKRYRDTGGSIAALEWNEYRKTLGDELMEVLDKYQVTPERAMHYLQRTRQSGQTLADTWDMSARLGLDMTDPQVLFPKELRATHDRLAVTVAELAQQEKAEKTQQQFRAILDRYGHLEWSDGEICIRLPRSFTELVREGATLHHCVGGYGDKHSSGSDVIWFVRHARRPERSWYTLDIRMNAGEPREVQLHGYKNELVHGKVLRIPRRVREFVNRWEREVLLPGWKRAQRQAEQPKKQAKKENAA